jgi:hypothetical protein
MKTADIIETQKIHITSTNGSRANGISGSRLTVWDGDKIVDRFEVPKHNGLAYCLKYENGAYGRRLRAAVESVAMV